jgi:hypothetical protein
MTEQVPVSTVQDWLKKSISTQVTQAERERDKVLSEISRTLDSLPQFCSQLSQKAETDMEKRDNRAQYRAAKAVVRLTGIVTGMCESVEKISSKSSVSLRNLQRQTSKLASEAARAREEWLRQIRPYYIIDMMTLGGNIDKVRRLGDELHDFLMGRGSLLRSLEELNEKVEALSKLKLSKESTSSQRESTEMKLQEAQLQEKKLREQIDQIRENPKMKEYIQIDSELRTLRSELLRTGFSRLGRPLKKLISISERGNYPISIEIREKADDYARKPFTTFLKEEQGHPQLKAVMTALSNAVSSGKLALKQREAKKVIERTQRVVDGSLEKIHSRSKELKKLYDSFVADPETSGLVQQLRELRKQGKANHETQKELNSELQRIIENENHAEEQVDLALKEIEAFVRKLSGSAPKLQLA